MDENRKKQLPDVLAYGFSLCLVVFLMGLIFHFSSANADGSSALSGGICVRLVSWWDRTFSLHMTSEKIRLIADYIEFPIRKCAHFLEYAALSFAIQMHMTSWKLFAFPVKSGYRSAICWLGLLTCSLYALTDEIHQYFVPGRACRLYDVGVDSFGAFFGMSVFFLLCDILIRIRRIRKEGRLDAR